MAEKTALFESFLSCHVCSETFRDPVSLGCNHSFCSSCLQTFWEQSKNKNCPICKRKSSKDRPVNFALKELSDSFAEREKAGSSETEKGEKKVEVVCSKHPEEPRLFCRMKRELCVLSSHKVVPVEQAVSELKDLLKSDLESLQDKRDKYKGVETTYNEVIQGSKKQLLSTESQIRAEFIKLHQFLKEEEESRLAALREEEEQKGKTISREMKSIQEHISSLSHSISAVEEELQKHNGPFLSSYKATQSRARVQSSLSDPQLLSGALTDVAKHLGNLSFRVWEKMKDQSCHSGPKHCSSWLSLSDDLTSVRQGETSQQLPDNPERFTNSAGVLGSEGFSSGKHSWEVEVGDHPHWIIGLTKESADRKGEIPGVSPKYGIWCLWHGNGRYTNGDGETVRVEKNLQRIRVQLDYDRGEVSFYDPEHMTHIYTHSDTFTEKLFPYFSIGKAGDAKTADIKICQNMLFYCREQSHKVVPVEQAVSELKDLLKSDLESLQDKRDKYKGVETTYNEVIQGSKKQLLSTESQIRAEFIKLHQFLKEEEESRLAALREEEEQKGKTISREMKSIQEHISSLSHSISAVEEELQKHNGPFLSSYKATQSRARVQSSLSDPQLLSGALTDVAKHLGNLSFRVWEKMKDQVHFSPVILDPNTANSWLSLSDDLTSVRQGDTSQQLPDNPERFTNSAGVLGSEGFSSGKHSWEVETFRDPVSLGCNHSFCSSCLQTFWEQSKNKNCPICKRKSSKDRPVNFALKELSDSFAEREKAGSSETEKGEKKVEVVCSKHPEEPRLFCRMKRELCVLSSHKVVPVEQAVSELKDLLKSDLESLQDKRDKYKGVETTYNEVIQGSKKQLLSTESQIRAEFIKLHQFLKEEEESRLAALREEEQKGKTISREMKSIQEHISSLSHSISAVEEELQKHNGPFLSSYKATQSRARVQSSLSDPQLLSGALTDVAKHLGNLSFRVWEKMKDQVHFSPVILDPNTAQLALSCEKGDTSQQLPDNPERFTNSAGVLGSEGFSSGKHSWEVEVGDHPHWIIGLTKESADRKGDTRFSPKYGIWCLWHGNGRYTNGDGETVRVEKNLQRIRVQLDYDRGEVSFYDPEHMTHIYTHSDTFTEKLFPYFSIGKAGDAKTADIKICQSEIPL
ncbi:hypothetical protein F7725_008622 [Dissostichus mawsoni]|uniref:Uncharacterized protein n=1 Tax=Dissostichus mawsoni TaxID=36200 RepID=A0A7J5Y9M6_DISMA|nr:hypothetical protein F7725_008622 [Dissostichus mawsoni]